MNYLKLLDYIFITRPILLIPLWIFLFLGYYTGTQNLESPLYPSLLKGKLNGEFYTVPSTEFLLLLIVYTLLAGGIYIINQIFDRKTDQENNKLFFISKEIISLKLALIESMFLVIAGLLLSIIFSKIIQILLFISIMMGILYSVPPVRIKGRPIIDMIFNAVGYGFVAYTTGWLIVSDFSLRTFITSIPYLFAISAMFVFTTIPDIKGDEKNGDITTGVWLKERNTAIIGCVFLLGSIVSSYYIKNYICLITAIISLPFYIKSIITCKERNFLLSFKISGAVFSLFVSLLSIYILVLFGLTFIITKWYYHKRFGIVYPA